MIHHLANGQDLDTEEKENIIEEEESIKTIKDSQGLSFRYAFYFKIF